MRPVNRYEPVLQGGDGEMTCEARNVVSHHFRRSRYLAAVGLEVPHAHVHLIPLNEMDEMRFQNKVSLSKEEFEVLAQNIKENL